MEIWLKNEQYNIRFPIHPASYTYTEESGNTQEDISAFGQINLIGNRRLKSIAFSTFFPARNEPFCQIPPEYSPSEYRDIFQEMKESGVCVLTMTDRNISLDVTIESMTSSENDGTGDITIDFQFLEYRKPTSERTMKVVRENKYVVPKKMSFSSIAKKITGANKNWTYIYEDNKSLFATTNKKGKPIKYKKGSKVPKGTVLTIRQEYPYITNKKMRVG